MGSSGTGSNGMGRSEAEALIAEAKKALWVMVGLIALIWIVQVFNWLANYSLSLELGIMARNPASLPDIFTAELVHGGWAHIEGNSGPLFIFGFLAAFRGVKKWLWVTLLIVIVSGLGVWVTGPENSITVGASGLLFGYLGYVLFRGLFDRRLIDIVIGVVLALSFAYTFISLLPLAGEGISWQGHLFGFLAGVVGGWLFRERKAKPERDKGLPTTLIN
jgi:membrane associated rhomboid family serine protease